MDNIKLTINGRNVTARADSTVLEAARAAEIYVPTLCYDPDLKPWGACRLCLVEIDGMRGFPASCATPAQDGMVVRTETPDLNRLRRSVLELLLSDHPDDCLTCRKNQHCELQWLVAYFGLARQRLPKLERKVAIDDSNPFFDRDLERCILCGRCVGACDQIQGVGAIEFGYRSFRSKIVAAMDQPLAQSNCVSCGECVAHCPVGALVPRRCEGLPDKEVTTVCPYCGCGCGIRLQVRGDRIIGVEGVSGHPASRGALCVKGRFGFDFVNHSDRLTKPLIRKGEQFVAAGWDEALDLVATRLHQHRDAFGMLSSAKCSNEDNYVAQKFARMVMGTNNLDHCARR